MLLRTLRIWILLAAVTLLSDAMIYAKNSQSDSNASDIDKKASTASTQQMPESSAILMTIQPEQVLCHSLLGIGNQGDFQLTCNVNTERGVTDKDVQFVLERVRQMRPQLIRTFFAYQWWEPKEGKQTPNSEYMKDYVKWVRFLNSIGCQVNLCPWGDWFAYSPWMNSDPDSRWPADDKRAAMVRSLVDLVKYLRKDQGLTNVSYLTLMNEPDNSKRKPTPKEFIETCKILDDELKRQGMRKEIFLVGIDGSSWSQTAPGDWFYDILAQGGSDYFDGASAHTYGEPFNCSTLTTWCQSRTNAMSKFGAAEKPFMAAEFGSFGPARGGIFTMTDNDTYNYGLFLARFATIALANKAANISMWCLFDVYYDTLNKQEAGLWRFKNEGWEPRPGFYSWSLLTRYTRIASKVVAVQSQPQSENSVPAVALISPQGELTFLCINGKPATTTIRLNPNQNQDLRLDYFEYSQRTVPTIDKNMILASKTVEFKAGQPADIDLPAESFIVLTNIEQKDRDDARLLTNLDPDLRQAASAVLAIPRQKLPFYHPDRALIIAPDAKFAKQLSCFLKTQRPDFWVITFTPGYKNPVPLPNTWTIKTMIGAATQTYVIVPGKGYPKKLLQDFDLVKIGSIYKAVPLGRDQEPF